MSESWRQVTDEEQELIRKLLSSSFPGRDTIAVQIATALVHRIDVEGSLAFRIESEEVAEVERRIPIEAEAVDADGVSIHALLHVVDGKLRELEIYKDDSTLVVKMPLASEWKLLEL